jgi:PKD repeat protein
MGEVNSNPRNVYPRESGRARSSASLRGSWPTPEHLPGQTPVGRRSRIRRPSLGLAVVFGIAVLISGLVLSGALASVSGLGFPSPGVSRSPVGPQPTLAMAASAAASPMSGAAPLDVAFQGGVTGGRAPVTYSWSFGDGNTSPLASPSHIYTTAGTYGASLTVADSLGSKSGAGVTIVVSGAGVAGVAGSLVTGALAARTPGTFFSVDAQTSCARCISSSSAVTTYLASTPFHWVRYGQGDDECNLSADLHYSEGGAASKGCGFNITALKTYCQSTTPNCHAILNLPGENNNSREDAAIAYWIVHTVGFQPDYWSIGNEPTGWTHYGIAWSHWKTTDSSHATPLAYAYDVKAAIAAISAVDPGAKFIGIEAACSCNTVWFQDTVKVNGPSLSAIGVHNYPSGGSSRVNLAQFYAPLSSSDNVTNSVASVRTAIRGLCTSCATLPILVNEYNAGPGWTTSNYAGSYANAVFLAASVSQALTSNVTQLTVFNLESSSLKDYGYALLDYHGAAGPTGLLFSGVLSHLARGSVYADRVVTVVPHVWAVTTTNATTESILVVNTNLTHAVALSLGLDMVALATGTVRHWAPGVPAPLSVFGALASSYSVPPQGILLVDVPLSLLLVVPALQPTPSSPPVVPSGVGVADGLVLLALGAVASGSVVLLAVRRTGRSE